MLLRVIIEPLNHVHSQRNAYTVAYLRGKFSVTAIQNFKVEIIFPVLKFISSFNDTHSETSLASLSFRSRNIRSTAFANRNLLTAEFEFWTRPIFKNQPCLTRISSRSRAPEISTAYRATAIPKLSLLPLNTTTILAGSPFVTLHLT